MYHHHHHGKNGLFLQGGNGRGDAGLVLSTDAKPRLKWTPELHEHFIEAVNQIGGADKATPKTVMKLMGIPGLTLYHLKSHLQKYRLSKNPHGQTTHGSKNGFTTMVEGDRLSVESGALMTNTSLGSQTNKSLQISEALQMQIEVQRRLHEQLEVQRHLQLRIEAQGKYLQSVLEKAQETLGRQNLGTVGLEAAKVQLSELASKVSTECLNSAFSGSKELPGLCNQQTQPTDCSIDSCLTSCEGSQKDQEMHNIGMGLGPFRSNTCLGQKEIREESKLEEIDPIWCKDLNENKMFLSSIERDAERMMFPVQRNSSDFSMSIRVPEEKGSSSSISASRPKERDGNDNFHDQINARRAVIQQENEKNTKGSGLPYLKSKLDLNSHDENDTTSGCKQFDLNGFSWS